MRSEKKVEARVYWATMLMSWGLLFASPALAQSDLLALDELDAELSTDSTGLTSNSRGPSIESVRGFIAEEIRTYPRDRNHSKRDEQLLTEIELKLDIRLYEGLSLKANPWFLVDVLDTDLLRYEPLEAYFLYRAENWDVLAGQFIESWGIADTFNPIDILNRKDAGVDIFDPKTRGELGARMRWTLPNGEVIGEPTFGLYVLPYFRQTELPTDRQRFGFSSENIKLNIDETSEPVGIHQMFAAIRFDHTLSTSALSADVQFLVARGPSHVSLISSQLINESEVLLIPQYFGQWTMGGGFRAVPSANFWSKFTFKAEIAYKRPYLFSKARGPAERELQVKPDDYLQFTTGFDRSISGLITTEDELTLTLEYAGEVWARDDARLLRPFDSDIALRVYWNAGDFSRTSLESRAIIDVTNAEVIAETIASRQLRFIHDDLKLEIAGRWLRSSTSETTLLSSLPTNNSSLKARLQFDF